MKICEDLSVSEGLLLRYSLRKLVSVVRSLKAEAVHVVFNNVYMHQDALRFKQLLNAT